MAEDNLTTLTKDNFTTEFSHQYTHSDIPLHAISFFGVISNALLLLAIFKDPLKCFRNSATYFVINLSVSDCLTCFFAPVIYIISLYIAAFKYETFQLFFICTGCTSLLSITTIAIDRFLMIAYPIKHRVLIGRKVTVTWIVVIWVVSCLVSVSAVFWSRRKDGTSVHTFCAFIVVLSTTIYVLTYYKLKKQSMNIALQTSSDSRAQKTRILKEKHYLKTIIIIACIAVVCVLPSMVLFQTFIFLKLATSNFTTIAVSKTFLCVFTLNFAVNPLIYVLRLPNYRKTFYLLYCKRWSTP